MKEQLGWKCAQSCLVLAVTLILYSGPQPGDALLAAALPQRHVLSVLVEVNAELACSRAVHVVVEAQALGPPGAPQGAGQQPDALTGQHGRRLHVQVVACQSRVRGFWVQSPQRLNMFLCSFEPGNKNQDVFCSFSERGGDEEETRGE